MIRKFYQSCILAGLIALGVSFEANSQNTEKSPPLSFSPYFEQVIAKNQLLETTTVPPLDMKKVDEDEKKGIGVNHFARHLTVNFDLQNSGVWHEMPNGDRVWRLKLHSAGATCLQPFFSEFNIPQGSKFYVYDKMNRIFGSFNEESNRKSGDFIVPFVEGNYVTIEYFEPISQRGKGKIKMAELSYGYRNDYYGKAKSVGENRIEGEKVNESDPCNININCPIADDWQIHKRGVARMIMRSSLGSGYCSGTLINNTATDQTPYFISAWHCWGGDGSPQFNNWQFLFNYESPGCANPASSAPPLGNLLTGCVMLEQSVDSDFLFLKLNATPAQLAVTNPYFVGWDRRGNNPTRLSGIHHPAGDIKKYSENINVVTNPVSTNTAPITFGGGATPLIVLTGNLWQFRWTSGWMQGGSSGSGLFDENKRLIGTLTGGTSGVANCDNSQRQNSYGKFARHWTNNTIIRQSLDPNNSGLTFIDGFDPLNNMPDNVGVSKIEITTNGCAYSANTPVTITVRNFGSASQSLIPVNYKVKNLTNNTEVNGSFNVTPNLAPNSSTTRNFNANLSIPGTTYEISAWTSLPNDGNLNNDRSQGSFSNSIPTIPSDNLAISNITSTSFKLSWQNGNANNRMVLAKKNSAITAADYPLQGVNYAASNTYNVGDNIGTASVIYRGSGSSVDILGLDASGTYFVAVIEYDCTPVQYLLSPINTLSTTVLSAEDNLLSSKLKVYPNPTSNYVEVELGDLNYDEALINFTNLVGKSVKKSTIKRENNILKSKIDITDLSSGIYILEINVGKSKVFRKLVVN